MKNALFHMVTFMLYIKLIEQLIFLMKLELDISYFLMIVELYTNSDKQSQVEYA